MFDRSVSSCFGLYSGEAGQVAGAFVTESGERFYRIDNYDRMPPFFMTVISPSNHWLFISATGGVTAGRSNAKHALFPYYTEDRIAENSGNTGSSTIIRLKGPEGYHIWEPFSDRCEGLYRITRSLMKNMTGSRIIFEERNLDLELMFRLEWTSSPRRGIVKHSRLDNISGEARAIVLLDGIMNTLPGNVDPVSQNVFSNVLDAYKRQELDRETGMGMFYLNSEMSDRAEPAESLYANTWWQRGLEVEAVLLSSNQLALFRRTGQAETEEEVRGRRGAYHVKAALNLYPGETKEWYFCGEVDQDHKAISELRSFLSRSERSIIETLEEEITAAGNELMRIIGRNDGLQLSGRELSCSHHAANVLFNTMRGGYFVNLSAIRRDDLIEYLRLRNRQLPESDISLFRNLPETAPWGKLMEAAAAAGSRDTVRAMGEFLPLTFSRRHGDPSRPWNLFSIDTANPDGTAKIGYEGNWRDIFQNWEALLRSFPSFIFSVIRRFLNSTSADGYNPYRITAAGVDWERPDEDDPWSNIGYWSDHQIIYLCKLLELAEECYPGALEKMLMQDEGVYVDIPYRIRPLEKILEDPRNTIDYDEEKEGWLAERKETMGEDGVLLQYDGGLIVYASMVEKILVLILAKLVNFVPDGGIWMNTQRPEWNDANNALVGYGLSMVTLAYLDRFIAFLNIILEKTEDSVPVHLEVLNLFTAIETVLKQYRPVKEEPFSDRERLEILLKLGSAGSSYRGTLYGRGFSPAKERIEADRIRSFLTLVRRFFECTIERNYRADGLFHSYKRIAVGKEGAEIVELHEMLEGQVAALSTPACSPEQAVRLYERMRRSTLYREDQDSFMLYPNRKLKGFLEKNLVRPEELERYPLIRKAGPALLNGILEKDREGNFHFSPDFRNAASLVSTFGRKQTDLSEELRQELLALYEATFDHKSFTGRSGTFFAYEGLGSIYWHMVSKLLLAVQEKMLSAWRSGDTGSAGLLRKAYIEIRNGLGFRKSAETYGAFPADPYSHTPLHSGAKQPGMTGQVKEEIITRLLENGVLVSGGRIFFTAFLVDDEELLSEPSQWVYYDVYEQRYSISVPRNCFAFTLCGVPVIAGKGEPKLIIHYRNREVRTSGSLVCSPEESLAIFNRSGEIEKIEVLLPEKVDGQRFLEELRSSPGM